MGAGDTGSGDAAARTERYALDRFTSAFGRPRDDGRTRRWRCALREGAVWVELKRHPSIGAVSLRIEPERAEIHALISKIKFTELRDPAQVDVVLRELEAERAGGTA